MTVVDLPFADVLTSTSDEVRQAAQCWRAGSVEYFDFACIANSIVGKHNGDTERLAKEIRCSVDTIERYAAAGALWLAMLQYHPSEAEIWRNDLEITFWVVIGARFKADVRAEMKKEKPDYSAPVRIAKYWFEETLENKWTVETLRAKLPARKEGSPFTRSLRRIVNEFEKNIINAPALDSKMTDREYKTFIKVGQWLVNFAKKKLEAQP